MARYGRRTGKKQTENEAIGYKIITKAFGLLKTLHYLCCVKHTLTLI